jgi:arsenate reductase (thioredoxin)
VEEGVVAVKKSVLFFCTRNSIRSQMAEGFLRAFHGDRYDVYSAGLNPTGVSVMAVRVMAELGIDLSGCVAKGMEVFVGKRFDCVATVCGDPKGPCPMAPRGEEGFLCKGCSNCCAFHPLFPAGERILHCRFRNLAGVDDREEDIDLFRQVRDAIGQWVEETFG